MVPLGEGFTVADLIAALECRVIVAARNRLGTINHTLLTIKALQTLGLTWKDLSVVLMSGANSDLSSRSNLDVITQLLGPITVHGVAFLGPHANSAKTVRKHCTKLKFTLSRLLEAEAKKSGKKSSKRSQKAQQ